MRHILLIGRNGQVGYELERALAPIGAVLALDRSSLDLVDADAIRDVIRRSKSDIIVNAAAYTAVDQAEDEADLAMRINGIAPGIMAEESKRQQALLVHYSTDYVFDGTKSSPYIEADQTNPLSVYGRTKLAGEQAIVQADCAHLILRTSWVYGARGKNFLRTILRLASEREELRVVSDQLGAPTWCRFIAETTARMIGHVAQEGIRETYHLVNGGIASWHEFAAEILELARQSHKLRTKRVESIHTEDYPTKAIRPRYSVLSTEKLRADFGIGTPPWRESLKRCFEEMPVLR